MAVANATRAVALALDAYEKASATALEAQARHGEAVAAAEAHEGAFISAQASVLAQRLQDGHPCPVCSAKPT